MIRYILVAIFPKAIRAIIDCDNLKTEIRSLSIAYRMIPTEKCRISINAKCREFNRLRSWWMASENELRNPLSYREQ